MPVKFLKIPRNTRDAAQKTLQKIDGMMPMEDDSCPEGHWRPDGYVYQGYTKGNSEADGRILDGMAIITFAIPGINILTKVISLTLLAESIQQQIELNGRIPGNYIKYVYKSSGNYFWYHIVWQDTIDGWPRYLTCTVE